MQFELAAPFKMSPGQAEAVKKLAENFQKKDKQTLLGITGSGKSVTPDTNVVVRKNGVQCKQKIGSLVDTLLSQNRDKIRLVNGTEILESSYIPDVFETYSFNRFTKKIEWKKIRQFIRHNSPDYLYEVKSTCGRQVTVTEDHNFLALRDAQLTLLNTRDLKNTDFLPVPRKIDEPTASLEAISVSDNILGELKLFVSIPNFASLLEENQEKIGTLLDRSKIYAISHFNERVNLETYNKLVAIDTRFSEEAKFGLFHGNNNLPLTIKLTDEFLRFLGYYIAEGHVEKEYFLLSSSSDEIIADFRQVMDRLGIYNHKRPETYDFACYSTYYASLLNAWCGKDSCSKHLPDFWMQLSNRQLANLLRGYFSGDGGINGQTVSCITKSNELASDIAYALLRFGVLTRSRKRMMLLPEKNIRSPYVEIIISGQRNLKIFLSEIGFESRIKNETLQKIIPSSANTNTNVDVIPANVFLKKIRERLGVSQEDISVKADVKQSYVSLLENGHRSPSRDVAKRFVDAFYELEKEKNKLEVHSYIQQLEGLLEFFWSPVKEVRSIEGNGYVYDFSVEDNETFLAGYGGLFVHNTFVMANVINHLQKPTLIISHNKILAAQLYSELKAFFPNNRVEYFISFYDYYQPESYLPAQDMYIEKDSDVNEEIEKMRMHAVSSLVSRNDTIIVASISCIYSLGNPDDFRTMALDLAVGKAIPRQDLIHSLVDMQYERNDMVLEPGRFRVRGNTVDIVPSYENDILRIEFDGSTIGKLKEVNHLTGDSKASIDRLTLYPARQYVVPEEKHALALEHIKQELDRRLTELPPLEAQRLKQRTNYDLEMIREIGFCSGMENYSRHFDGRRPGEPPFTLMDYFPKDYLLIIDESHQTIPQAHAMYNGDYSRKKNLVDFGFRLPSALDNRPLKFDEFERKMGKVLFVSATPAEYERELSGSPVELITRPTGLLDPQVELHPIAGQMQHLMVEAKKTIERGDRILITTLTKRMAEDLADYLAKEGFRVRYMHSDIESLDRIELVRQLRVGEFDVLVGINLLREGLDIPEVATIFILDADKEGFLRDERSLIQTIGRAARNVNGRVILYADVETASIKRAMEITNYRRAFQQRYNQVHGITPTTIVKSVSAKEGAIKGTKHLPKSDMKRQMVELEAKMREAAEKLDFERAIQYRDAIAELQRALAKKIESES